MDFIKKKSVIAVIVIIVFIWVRINILIKVYTLKVVVIRIDAIFKSFFIYGAPDLVTAT